MNNVPKKHTPNVTGPATGNSMHNNAAAGPPKPAPAAPLLANYTLPGVISYLTSEFTNLERFKIITNLEKSEMKYRIQQLTSELNTVRYLNEKQALRIQELEAQLDAQSGGHLEGSGHDKSGVSNQKNNVSDTANDTVNNTVNDPANDPALSDSVSEKLSDLSVSSRSGGSVKEPGRSGLGAGSHNDLKQTTTQDIPYIHLDAVRDARQTLNESIREIIDLLRPPSSAVENIVRPAENSYADLLESADSFLFDASPEKPQGLFERYTLKSEDTLADQKAAFEDEIKESNSLPQSAEESVPSEESDAETVIADEIQS